MGVERTGTNIATRAHIGGVLIVVGSPLFRGSDYLGGSVLVLLVVHMRRDSGLFLVVLLAGPGRGTDSSFRVDKLLNLFDLFCRHFIPPN